MKDTRGALSPLAANSLLVLAAVVVSLLVCELLLRLLGVSYPVLDWTDPVRGVARRSSFVIDRSGIVRWAVHNELPDGRDLDEHLARLHQLD